MPEIERQLGSRYFLEEELGRGGMGIVWRGRDHATNVAYAIKIVRPELAQDDKVVARFIRERRALTQLRHPNIVAVHDLIAEGDRLALVMDLIAGETLLAYRDRCGGTIPPGEASWLAAQICDALTAVHAAGIVHRDLKPANVLLDQGGERLLPIRLADFGIALEDGGTSVTSTGMLVGTAEYLAPEIIDGLPPGPAADVYAFGITLYELLAGRTPFHGGHTAAVIRRHLEAEPLRPDGVPDELWSIIAECLAKDPAQRPAAAALAIRLHHFAPGPPADGLRTAPPTLADVPAAHVQPATTPPGPPWPLAPSGPATGPAQAGRTVRRPVVIAALATATVLAAAGAAIAVGLSSGPGRGGQAAGGPAGTGTHAGSTGQGVKGLKARLKGRTRAKALGQPSSKGSTSPGATTSAHPVVTGWRCGSPVSFGGGRLQGCIRTDGTSIYLKGTFGPSSAADVSIRLVLLDSAGNKLNQTGHSPFCNSTQCTYQFAFTPPHGTYSGQPKLFFGSRHQYQTAGTQSPSVTV